MNKETIKTILEKIAQIKSVNLLENAFAAFPGEDLENIQATNDFSIANAIRLIDRCMQQFEEAFSNSENQILPLTISVLEVDGSSSSSLIARLDELLTYAQTKDTTFNQIGSSLRWLISYQQMFGIWDKSEKKIHSVDEIKLKEQQKELAALSKKLTEVLKSSEELAISHASNIKQLEDLIRTKNDEFVSLANMVGKANNETSQITQLWEQATRQKGEFDNLINQANQGIANIGSQNTTQKGEFETLKSALDTERLGLVTTIQEAQDSLESIEGSKLEINQRLEEAKRLLGLSGDVALGGKFSQREIAVKGTLTKWLNRIIQSAIIAVIWAVIVFTWFKADTGIAYLDLLVNLVKTSPGFIIMGFIMAQYNKERALEEEYAFRAAVAETINAYADLLEGKDEKDLKNESRQKMLLDAIKQVYAKPQMHKENIKAKTYKESAAELIEILKNIKS
jgi:hypothetical protein